MVEVKGILLTNEIWSGLISALVSGTFLIINNYIFNKRSEKIQEKLNQDKIDANIVASSRIKWIQEVRQANIEYMISIINFTSCKTMSNRLHFLRESYKMMSYFPQVLSGSNNYQDNDYINELISAGKKLDSIKKAYENASRNMKLNDDEENFFNCMYNLIENDNSNEFKNKYIHDMFIIDNNRILHFDISSEEVDKILNRTKTTISVYLKLEWDRAKNNE